MTRILKQVHHDVCEHAMIFGLNISAPQKYVIYLHGNMEKTVDLIATLRGTQLLDPILYVGRCPALKLYPLL
jgi:hypothetical protein